MPAMDTNSGGVPPVANSLNLTGDDWAEFSQRTQALDGTADTLEREFGAFATAEGEKPTILLSCYSYELLSLIFFVNMAIDSNDYHTNPEKRNTHTALLIGLDTTFTVLFAIFAVSRLRRYLQAHQEGLTHRNNLRQSMNALRGHTAALSRIRTENTGVAPAAGTAATGPSLTSVSPSHSSHEAELGEVALDIAPVPAPSFENIATERLRP